MLQTEKKRKILFSLTKETWKTVLIENLFQTNSLLIFSFPFVDQQKILIGILLYYGIPGYGRLPIYYYPQHISVSCENIYSIWKNPLTSELFFHQKYYLHKKISVFLFTLHGVWIWLPSGKNDWRFLMPRMGKLFSFYPDQHRIVLVAGGFRLCSNMPLKL